MKRAKLLLLALFTVTMLFGCGKKEEALSEQPTENKPEEVTESVIIETGNMVTSYLTTNGFIYLFTCQITCYHVSCFNNY